MTFKTSNAEHVAASEHHAHDRFLVLRRRTLCLSCSRADTRPPSSISPSGQTKKEQAKAKRLNSSPGARKRALSHSTSLQGTVPEEMSRQRPAVSHASRSAQVGEAVPNLLAFDPGDNCDSAVSYSLQLREA